MANLFNRAPSKNQKGRSGFDMSQNRIFSCHVGQLLPCYYDFGLAGDKYKINSRIFVRTEALQSAAMVRMKAHVEWFFVPIQQLYQFWNEVYNMTNDVHTSFLNKNNALSKFASGLPMFPTDFSKWATTSVDNWLSSKWLTLTDGKEINESCVELKVDMFGQPYAWNFRRLYDMVVGSVDDSRNRHANDNLLRILAYHKIFYGHYRNEHYTANDPSFYNIDRYSDTLVQGDSFSKELFLKLYSSIHYRPWRKDYFTNIFPAPTFTPSYADFLTNSLYGEDSTYVKTVNPEEKESDVSFIFPNSANSDSLTLDASVGSIGQIRAMYAMDRLLRVTASTGSHYDEQTLAHLGYKVPKGIDNEPYYIGEQICDVNINEVVTTATTATEKGSATTVKGAGTVVGDIAGKGFGVSNGDGDLEFTCPCEGLIVGIYSIEPIADYRQQSDEFNTYSNSFDFYHPELDDLGMQPFSSAFVDGLHDGIAQGWQYRYSQFKCKYDAVSESIWNSTKSTWAASRPNSAGASEFDEDGTLGITSFMNLRNLFYISPTYTNGIFTMSVPTFTYVASQTGNIAPAALTHSLYFNPANLDSGRIPFVQVSDLKANKVYSFDNFINDISMKVYKTSIMSVYSLPN